MSKPKENAPVQDKVTIKQKLLVIGINPYEFTSDSGEVLSGTTVYYGIPFTNEESRGYKTVNGKYPLKANVPFETGKQMQQISNDSYPCHLTAVMEVVPGSLPKIVNFEV